MFKSLQIKNNSFKITPKIYTIEEFVEEPFDNKLVINDSLYSSNHLQVVYSDSDKTKKLYNSNSLSSILESDFEIESNEESKLSRKEIKTVVNRNSFLYTTKNKSEEAKVLKYKHKLSNESMLKHKFSSKISSTNNRYDENEEKPVINDSEDYLFSNKEGLGLSVMSNKVINTSNLSNELRRPSIEVINEVTQQQSDKEKAIVSKKIEKTIEEDANSPLYIMMIEMNNESKIIPLYKNDKPDKVAFEIAKENNLNHEMMKYLEDEIRNIINNNDTYDNHQTITSNNKNPQTTHSIDNHRLNTLSTPAFANTRIVFNDKLLLKDQLLNKHSEVDEKIIKEYEEIINSHKNIYTLGVDDSNKQSQHNLLKIHNLGSVASSISFKGSIDKEDNQTKIKNIKKLSLNIVNNENNLKSSISILNMDEVKEASPINKHINKHSINTHDENEIMDNLSSLVESKKFTNKHHCFKKRICKIEGKSNSKSNYTNETLITLNVNIDRLSKPKRKNKSKYKKQSPIKNGVKQIFDGKIAYKSSKQFNEKRELFRNGVLSKNVNLLSNNKNIDDINSKTKIDNNEALIDTAPEIIQMNNINNGVTINTSNKDEMEENNNTIQQTIEIKEDSNIESNNIFSQDYQTESITKIKPKPKPNNFLLKEKEKLKILQENKSRNKKIDKQPSQKTHLQSETSTYDRNIVFLQSQKAKLSKLENELYSTLGEINNKNKESLEIIKKNENLVFCNLFKILDKDQDNKINYINMNYKQLDTKILNIIRPILIKILNNQMAMKKEDFIKEISQLYQNLDYYKKKDLLSLK